MFSRSHSSVVTTGGLKNIKSLDRRVVVQEKKNSRTLVTVDTCKVAYAVGNIYFVQHRKHSVADVAFRANTFGALSTGLE